MTNCRMIRSGLMSVSELENCTDKRSSPHDGKLNSLRKGVLILERSRSKLSGISPSSSSNEQFKLRERACETRDP
jgi:hypothetical protein